MDEQEELVNDALPESWERTRGHLARAWVELPSGDSADLSAYHELLDHNELELAMEELQRVGEHRTAPRSFWAALSEAAVEMGLDDWAELYRSRAGFQGRSNRARPPGT
jgi:hypothetical protein